MINPGQQRIFDIIIFHETFRVVIASVSKERSVIDDYVFVNVL